MTRPVGCPADELLTTEPDASLRSHVDSCARCRARVAQLRAFMSADAAPGARVAEADTQLAEALDAAIFGEAAPAAGASALPRRAVADERPSWWQALFAPALRPAWGFAVVAVVAGGVWLAQRPERAEVRGGGASPVAVETLEPVAGEHAVTLAWKPVAGATRYDVLFLADDLSELGAPVRVSEPVLVLSGDALPPGTRSGQSVLWIVTAREGERELSHSVAVRVTLP